MQSKFILLTATGVLIASALSAQRNASFTFVNKQHMVIVPFYYGNDHIFIKLKVNNSDSLDILFDPGWHCNGILLDSGVASEAQFPVADSVSLAIKALAIARQRATWTSLKSLEFRLRHKVDGVLGYDFAWKFVVRIDPLHKRLILTDPAFFADHTLKGKIRLNTPIIDLADPLRSGKTVTLNYAHGYMIVSD